MIEVAFRFDNPEAAQHFLDWLDGQGEQDYWLWMEYRERETPTGDITVTHFRYPRRTGEPVVATCGRLDKG